MLKQILGRKNTIQAIQLLLITLLFVTACAWGVNDAPQGYLWLFRVATPLAAIATAWWLWKVMRQPERYPDLLRQLTRGGRYLEKDGVCFAPTFDIANDGRTCMLGIAFQNRNSGHASVQIVMNPLAGSFHVRAPKLSPIRASIECPGGAFGVWRFPYPIPAKYQGKTISFAVGADTKYPAGRGELLRWRTGMRVSSVEELRPTHQLAVSLLALCIGILYIKRPGSVTLTLPRGVTEALPPDAPTPATAQEILWTPEIATGGFPILPARKAA